MNNLAIGVFDSGVGGLTVYRALRAALPHENFVYLGDTARLPYGTKSSETVAQYGLQAARYLAEEKIKLLVVACNTASALALDALQDQLPELPSIGVIEPSAEEAVRVSKTGKIAVLATESTVRSRAYQDAILRLRPDAKVQTLACNLLVAMAEEGWCDGAEAEMVVGRYVRGLGTDFDSLVLGCTHFPLLAGTIQKQIGAQIPIINSAETTARKVAELLDKHGLNNAQSGEGSDRFLVTDSPERFGMLAKRFLNTDRNLDIALANLSPNSHTTAPAASKHSKVVSLVSSV